MYNMYNMSKVHISIAGTVTVGPKGQVVIPADVREKMAVAPGDKLIALFVEDKNAISFITEGQVEKLVNKMGDNLSALERLIEKK